MELSSKILEQIAFITRPNIDEHMSIIMNKSTHKEHLSQPLQTNIKQFEITVTKLTGYNGIFIVTNKNNYFSLNASFNDNDFNQVTPPQKSFEIESLHNQLSRIIIEEGFLTEVNYPITIKPNPSILRVFVEISSKNRSSQIILTLDDSKRDLLGFEPKVIQEEYESSGYPVDILSFDNFFSLSQGKFPKEDF